MIYHIVASVLLCYLILSASLSILLLNGYQFKHRKYFCFKRHNLDKTVIL